MEKVRTVLIGLGTVNIGLLRLLIDKKAIIESQYSLGFTIVGVADSSGIAINEEGFEILELITLKVGGGHVNELRGFLEEVTAEELPKHIDADLLVEASPVNLVDGAPGLPVVLNALRKEWSVVMANKAPLVLSFDAIHDMAASHEGSIAYSATVCGGLPVINVLKRDLKTARLKRFRGILNSTSNFVLDVMEHGGTLESAIKEAQQLGSAEANPVLDVGGQDAANKLFIIMRSFTDFAETIDDIEIGGIQNITSGEIKEALKTGDRIKLLGLAEIEDGNWKLSVRPTRIAKQSFLGDCKGWQMGFELETDLYEQLSMKKYEEDPIGTSAAVLRDIIDVSLLM